MFGRLGVAIRITDAEQKIINGAVAEGLKFLRPQDDPRNQAKLVVSLYAWAVYLCFDAHVRRLADKDRESLIIQTGNAVINKHTRDEHKGYVKWLTYHAPRGTGALENHRLVREAFPFLFYRTLAHLWMSPDLEANIHPNTLKKVFAEWEREPRFLNKSVDFVGLKSQLDELCVAASVAAAFTYGPTTGRYIHRSIVPARVEDLPEEIDTFLSYAAEDRPLVSQIEDSLRGRGRRPWFDKDIIPQSPFDRQINNYLDDAQCVVVLWSPKSLHSSWVRAEALRAFDLQKLVSVVIDDVVPPVPFNSVQSFCLTRDGTNIEPRSLGPVLDFIDRRFALA